MLSLTPCVLASERDYNIIVRIVTEGYVWVECAGQTFESARHGILLHDQKIHKITLPMSVLDSSQSYKVCVRLNASEETEKTEYSFKPVPLHGRVRFMYISDTHGMVDEPLKAAQTTDGYDAVLCSGDFCNEYESEEEISATFELLASMTGGCIPVVFARGNHDYRGSRATFFADLISNSIGNTYYTFRLGSVWGIVLDCGEDKTDNECSHAVNCHKLRCDQVEFMNALINGADSDYCDRDVRVRLALCHEPVSTSLVREIREIYDIETELYSQWTELLNRLGIDLLISGHRHKISAVYPGSEKARYGVNYLTVVGADFTRPGKLTPNAERSYRCTCIEIDNEIRITTADSYGAVTELAVLPVKSEQQRNTQ